MFKKKGRTRNNNCLQCEIRFWSLAGKPFLFFFGWAKRGEVWPGGECVNVGLRVRGLEVNSQRNLFASRIADLISNSFVWLCLFFGSVQFSGPECLFWIPPIFGLSRHKSWPGLHWQLRRHRWWWWHFVGIAGDWTLSVGRHYNNSRPGSELRPN